MTSEPKPTAKALAEKAAIELDAAKAKAELLGRKSAEASAKFQAQAEIRRQKYMTKWLDEEFVQAHEADVALLASKAAFEEAVQKDPLMQVWLAHVRTSMRTLDDGQIAENFALKVGAPKPVYFPNHGTAPFFEVANLAIQQLARKLEGERVAEVYEALDAAAEGEGE